MRVLEAAVDSIRPMVNAGHQKLTVSLPTAPFPLDADPVRLGQVFSNLLNNAARYTEPGGHIWLTAERDGDRALVSVRDTGIGVDPAHLPRIFDTFAQESPAPERPQGGLGIGLSLVKGLVELHGGRVEARTPASGWGASSPSPCRWPRPPARPRRARAPGSSSRPPPRRSASWSWTTTSTRRGRSRGCWSLSGHEVETAHDGLEAVQAAGAFRPDVVLLDIGLPRLNGYEAAASIRAEPWGKDMLIVALTGWGLESDRMRAMEAGCDHHLTKPVEPGHAGGTPRRPGDGREPPRGTAHVT